MHDQAKQALLSKLLDLAQHMIPEPSPVPTSGLSWPQTDGNAHHLPEPLAEEFKKLARELSQKRPWVDRFTEGFISNGLSLVLIGAYENGPSEASQRLEGIVTMLDDYAVERTVYVPITGLKLAMSELQLGNVVLKIFDDDLFEAFVQKIDETTTNRVADQETEERYEQFKQLARDQLHGKVCAEFRTVAEPDRAIERARLEARQAVEFITYACVALLPPNAPQTNIVIGLDGEVPRQGPWTLSIADQGVNSSHSAPISAMPITVNESSLIGLQSVGVMTLSDILSRSAHQRSDWEKDLLRAIHWLATSQTQVDLKNRLVNLVTAVETLLTQGSGGITAAVAENVALLTGYSLEDRRQIKAFVSRMYGSRSGVSHGGGQEVVEADVNRLRSIVAQLLKVIIHRKEEWSSKKKLNEWLEERRLRV